MTHFTIDNNNNITVHATAAQAKALAGTERFSNEAALAKLAANWTVARLVEIHNTLTGDTSVKEYFPFGISDHHANQIATGFQVVTHFDGDVWALASVGRFNPRA